MHIGVVVQPGPITSESRSFREVDEGTRFAKAKRVLERLPFVSHIGWRNAYRGRSSAWLERLPVTQEVASSTLVGPVFLEMPYIVSVLQSINDNPFYVGQTTNLQMRIAEHNRGRVKSTKARIPWKLIYYETFASREKAIRREREIKARKSRRYIESLLAK